MLQLLSPRPGVARTRSLRTTTRERPCSNKTQGSPPKRGLTSVLAIISTLWPVCVHILWLSSCYAPSVYADFNQSSSLHSRRLLTILLLHLNFSISTGTFASSTSMLYLFSFKKKWNNSLDYIQPLPLVIHFSAPPYTKTLQRAAILALWTFFELLLNVLQIGFQPYSPTEVAHQGHWGPSLCWIQFSVLSICHSLLLGTLFSLGF